MLARDAATLDGELDDSPDVCEALIDAHDRPLLSDASNQTWQKWDCYVIRPGTSGIAM